MKPNETGDGLGIVRLSSNGPTEPDAIPRVVGARRILQLCGMCGSDEPLSRTHVPPQAVGNKAAVTRRHLMSVNGTLTRGRETEGGLHVPGLCVDCNRTAGRWDTAYAEFHRMLGPAVTGETALKLPDFLNPPAEPVAIGAVVRSILAGACALNPRLRIVQSPELPDLLINGDPFEMPDRFDLRLGWATGRAARITGSILRMDVLARSEGEGSQVEDFAAAQAHYAPIAWRLMYSGRAEVCNRQGWASINHWTNYPPTERRDLNTVCGRLPRVSRTSSEVDYTGGWIEMSADEGCHLALCDDIFVAGRNDSCPCASGKKFKKCCGIR